MKTRYCKSKYYQALRNGEHVPRKAKLAWLGRRKSRNKIIKGYMPSGTCHCPKCGCDSAYTSYYSLDEEWPLLYEESSCLRCHELVSVMDNGPDRYTLADEIKGLIDRGNRSGWAFHKGKWPKSV